MIVLERMEETRMDYVATAITEWHLMGIKAYLLKLREILNRDVNGVLYIEAHPKNGVLIKEENIQWPNGVYCEIVYEKKMIYRYLYRKELFQENVYVISPNFPDIILCNDIKKNVSKRPQAVVIDEGVGCYDTSMLRWMKSVYIDTNSWLSSVKFMCKKIYEHMIRYIKRIDVQYFTLFDFHGKPLKENKHVCNYYAKLLEGCKSESVPSKHKRYVILFTNPLEEEGNIGGTELKEIYSQLKNVVEKNGYAMLVRCHPREYLMEKYEGFEFLKVNASSSEDLLLKLDTKPAYVIGAHSTSLVTAKIFYGIPAITIGEMLLPICKTAYCKDLIQKYRNNFKDLLMFPQSLEDLENIVSEYEEIR